MAKGSPILYNSHHMSVLFWGGPQNGFDCCFWCSFQTAQKGFPKRTHPRNCTTWLEDINMQYMHASQTGRMLGWHQRKGAGQPCISPDCSNEQSHAATQRVLCGNKGTALIYPHTAPPRSSHKANSRLAHGQCSRTFRTLSPCLRLRPIKHQLQPSRNSSLLGAMTKSRSLQSYSYHMCRGFAANQKCASSNRDPDIIHLNIALCMVSLYFGGKSHVSIGQNVSFKKPCSSFSFSRGPFSGLCHPFSARGRKLASSTRTMTSAGPKGLGVRG